MSLPPDDEAPAHSSALAEFRAGVLTVLPVEIATVPFALLLGALAAQKGLSPLEVAAMSGIVFAGSSQFVALGLWQDPAPWALLAATAFTVNLRHVMMGASISRHLGRFGPVTKPVAMFFLADEIWAFAEKRALAAPLTPAYWAGLAGVFYLNWIAWTAVGAGLGAILTEPERYGFDFVFSAVFIGLIAGFWRGSRSAVVIAASAGMALLVERLAGGVWHIVAGGTAGAMVAAVLASLGGEAGDEA
ncbi:MAG: AzlC family ABC transporter permease [Hyphomicrobiaceae bacterium]